MALSNYCVPFNQKKRVAGFFGGLRVGWWNFKKFKKTISNCYILYKASNLVCKLEISFSYLFIKNPVKIALRPTYYLVFSSKKKKAKTKTKTNKQTNKNILTYSFKDFSIFVGLLTLARILERNITRVYCRNKSDYTDLIYCSFVLQVNVTSSKWQIKLGEVLKAEITSFSPCFSLPCLLFEFKNKQGNKNLSF